MRCFHVSGGLAAHEKALRAGNAALGLWVRAGAYVTLHLTDGHIPAEVARLYGRAAEVRALLAAGLWHAAGHGCSRCPQPAADGYVMHDYLEDNPSSDRVHARRAAATKRQERSRRARAAESGAGHAVTDLAVTRESRRDRRRDTEPSHGVTDGVSHAVTHASRDDDLPPPHPPHKKPPSPSGKGAAQNAAPPSRRDTQTNPQVATVVGAWVEAAQAVQGSRPAGHLVARVGKQARALLAEGHDPVRLEAAARSAGSRGWDDLGRELLRLGANARPAVVETAGGWDV